MKAEQNPHTANKFVLVEGTHVLGRITIVSLGNNLFLRILSGSNLMLEMLPLTVPRSGGSPLAPAPCFLLYVSLGIWGNAAEPPDFLFVVHFPNSETQKQWRCMHKKKKLKTGFLGWWDYSVWYYNDGSMFLYICLNPQNVQHPRVNPEGWTLGDGHVSVQVPQLCDTRTPLVGNAVSGRGCACVGPESIWDLSTLSILLWTPNCSKKPSLF